MVLGVPAYLRMGCNARGGGSVCFFAGWHYINSPIYYSTSADNLIKGKVAHLVLGVSMSTYQSKESPSQSDLALSGTDTSRAAYSAVVEVSRCQSNDLGSGLPPTEKLICLY